MPGIITFKTLAEAVKNGFEFCGYISDGCLVRRQTSTGWAMAVVTNTGT